MFHCQAKNLSFPSLADAIMFLKISPATIIIYFIYTSMQLEVSF